MNKDRRTEIAAIFPLIAAAALQVKDIRDMIEGIKDEEQTSFDEMPDGLKGSDRGQTAEAAIQALEAALEAVDTVDLNDLVSALEEASDRSSGLSLPEARLSKEEAEQRRYERLPQFAKEEIERLRGTVAATEAKAAAMFGNPEEGSVRPIVGDYMGPLRGKEIPAERITFPQVGITVYMEKRRGGDMLTIHAANGAIAIHPEVSNTISVRSETFR